MTEAPTLTDGIVTLRAHRDGDVQRVWEQCQDPASVRWTTVPSPYSHADAEDFVASRPARWASGEEWTFAVEYAGRFAGSVSLRDEGDARAEIAFGSHPDVRGLKPDGADGAGRSVMERALRLLLDWGFAQRRLATVVWWADHGNWASRKVAWRLGFSVDGTVRRWLPQRGELLDGWVGTLRHDEPREPRSTWLEVPVVEGDGVCLRPFREDDVVRLVEGSADPETQYWLAFLPRDPDLSYGWAYLEAAQEEYATASALRWAFSETPDGPLLGTAGLFRMRLGRSAEVGYWTHPDARGRGLTTRAAALAVGYAFDTLGLPRVSAYHTDGNAGSQRVLEAIGLRRVGIQRRDAVTGDGEVRDLVGYDVLREEWPLTEPTEPRLVGERIVLRPPRRSDVPRIVEACSSPEVQHWFGSQPVPYTEDEAKAWLRRARIATDVVRLAIADPDTDVMLGAITVFDLDPGRDGELGFWLHPDARGRGVMTEAVRLMAAYAFETLGLPKVKAAAAVDNAASRAVIERAGMRFYGVERLGTQIRTGLADLAWYDLVPGELVRR